MWDKIKLGLRITVIVIVGIAGYFAISEISDLMESRVDGSERVAILSNSLTVANDYGRASANKLKEVNSKYEKVLKEHNAAVTAYATLLAKYEYSKKEILKLKSQLAGQNNAAVPCVDGVCTVETCMPLFVGETISGGFKDYHLGLTVKLTRVNGLNWEWEFEYALSQVFKLEVIETTKADSTKSLNAVLFEVSPEGDTALTITEFHYASVNNIPLTMKWWSPTLKLGVHQPVFTSVDWYPCPFLGVAISSLYSPKVGDVLNLFQFEVGLTPKSGLWFMFAPVTYNLGSKVPFIRDLWIGVDVGINLKAQWTLGLSISTNL